jgi:hypothetical protein
MLLTDPQVTVEDALAISKENDIKKAVPFIRRLASLAMDLRGLDAAQIEKLKAEVRFKVDVKSLKAACDEILTKLEG